MASARDAASKLEQSRAAVRRLNQDLEDMGLDTKMTHYVAGQPFTAEMHEDTLVRVGALMTPKCGGCGRVDEQRAFLKCAGCKVTLYCSRACQKKDWKTHKPNCKSFRRLRKSEAPTTADGAYTFEGLAFLYQEHAMSKVQGSKMMEFAHTEQATGRRSGLWPPLWNLKGRAGPISGRREVLAAAGLQGVPDILNNPPDMLQAPPNDAGATALRAGGHWQELQLRHFGPTAPSGVAASSWEDMYERCREASRQHPLRWIEGFVLRPFVNRFVWFRLPGESGLHSPKQTLLDRIAFDGRCSAWTRRPTSARTRAPNSAIRRPRSRTVRVASRRPRDRTTSPSSSSPARCTRIISGRSSRTVPPQRTWAFPKSPAAGTSSPSAESRPSTPPQKESPIPTLSTAVRGYDL